jgi:hypothetical protein
VHRYVQPDYDPITQTCGCLALAKVIAHAGASNDLASLSTGQASRDGPWPSNG